MAEPDTHSSSDPSTGSRKESSSSSSSSSNKKRKVGQACVYCRRSHMTCDSQRPCKRCIKRDIGHLCHDETPGKGHGHAHHAMPKKGKDTNNNSNNTTSTTVPAARQTDALQAYISAINTNTNTSTNTNVPPPSSQSSSWAPPPSSSSTSAGGGLGGAGFLGLGGSDAMRFQESMGGGGGGGGDAAGGHEYNLLSEFLESLDGPLSHDNNSQNNNNNDSGSNNNNNNNNDGNTNAELQQQSSNTTTTSQQPQPPWAPADQQQPQQQQPQQQSQPQHEQPSINTADPQQDKPSSSSSSSSGAYAGSNLPGFSTKKEKFFLTAADQVDGPRDERLSKVIQAKYDAGLLRPYNHVKGYARLNTWMERNVSLSCRRRILKPLSVFRPRFRAVASSLSDIDLIYIEEAFERLLLDYDRVFSTQGIPSCLWRRTGEIYKGNREFAELVGVGIEELREGRVAIYEFMQEESACNYWEKYGAVSFDTGQKAVLTSCILVPKQINNNNNNFHGAATQTNNSNSVMTSGNVTPKGGNNKEMMSPPPPSLEQKTIHCCFSFTIRRDSFGCPTAIVGNFLPIPS
ncbi:unnamed protein product [Sympodiomycopsis kandeliae]